MKRLLALYPKRWRQRYGAELEALIDQERPNLSLAFDLVRGAMDAHLHPELGGPRFALYGARAAQVFVPGLGFRTAAGGLALKQPVERKRGAVSLWLGRVVSTHERTDVDYAFDGLDVDPPEDRPAWIAGTVELRDPSGRVYRAGWRGGGGRAGGRLSIHTTFEQLAPGTRHAELRVEGPLGAWEIPFDLVPIAESGAPDAVAVDASSLDNGVTVSATAVARGGDYTAIRLAGTGAPPIRFVRGLLGETRFPSRSPHLARPMLTDQNGSRYAFRSQVNSTWPEAAAYQETLLFAPLHEDAREVTLTLGSVMLEFDSEPCAIRYPTAIGAYELGGFQFRVVGTKPSHLTPSDIVFELEISPTADGARLLYPGQVLIAGASVPFQFHHVSERRSVRELELAVAHPGIEPFTVDFRYPVVEVPGRWELRFGV